MGEPLYRVGTGNYEYRLVLRCRQEARARFAKMRKDVLEKIELLDQKHGQLLSRHSLCQRPVQHFMLVGKLNVFPPTAVISPDPFRGRD